MNKFDILYENYAKYVAEDAEERAWEHRQIQAAAKKAKAMMEKGQKVNFNSLADYYGVSAADIKKACKETSNEAYGPEEFDSQGPARKHRHPILDDKDRLEDILHDLELIAQEKYINAEDRKNLLAAQNLVVKVANNVQRTISQTRITGTYPKR